MRILLVEDDAILGESTRKGLELDDFTVDWVRDALDAELAVEQTEYQLVLLDVGLPKKSGIEFLREMRKRGDTTPVVVITARDASLEDRVVGLDSGADDYMVKPFELKELTARIRAVVRRSTGNPSPHLEIGDLVVDPAQKSVVYRGQPVQTTRREFAVLTALALQPHALLSRAQLEEKLYGWDDEIESNTVEVIIHRLRKKLSHDAIVTVRGLGYRLNDTP